MKFVEPIRRRLATRVAEFTAALLGERRGEGETARLISSCPSYGAGRVNELASRQGPVDPLSCRRWRESETADPREHAICQEEKRETESERNKWRRGGDRGEKQRERERERERQKKENRERRKRPRVCMRERGWETFREALALSRLVSTLADTMRTRSVS